MKKQKYHKQNKKEDKDFQNLKRRTWKINPVQKCHDKKLNKYQRQYNVEIEDND